MWTLLGSPTSTVYVPLKVFGSDHIPDYMKKSRESDNAAICDAALALKAALGFEHGCEGDCRKVEKYVDRHFQMRCRCGVMTASPDGFTGAIIKYVQVNRRKWFIKLLITRKMTKIADLLRFHLEFYK